MSYLVPTDQEGIYLCCTGDADYGHQPGCPVPELVAEVELLREALRQIEHATFVRNHRDLERMAHDALALSRKEP